LFNRLYVELSWAREAMERLHADARHGNPALQGSAKRYFIEVHGRGFNLS
jgi:hypothetical protein